MAEIPLDETPQDALERLAKWRHVSRDHWYEIGHPGGDCCATVELYWQESGNWCSVLCCADGVLVRDPLGDEVRSNWHTNDTPAYLAATINAAIDAAERAETEST